MDWQAMMSELHAQCPSLDGKVLCEDEIRHALQVGSAAGCDVLGTAVMSVLDGLFWLSTDGLVKDCLLSERMNSSADHLKGRLLFDILPRDSYHAVVDAMEYCRSNHTYAEFNFKYHNGISLLTLSGSLNQYRDGYIVAIRDVSRRQELFERLEQSEQRYQMIANSISDIITITDTESRFTFVSKSVAAIVGWLPEQLLGRSVYEYIHPQDVPAIRAASRLQKVHLQPVSHEFRFLKAAGGYVWFETVVQAILDGEGKLVAFQGVSRDVTEHRATERRLRQLWHLFEQSSSMLAVVNPEGKLDYINPSMTRYLGMCDPDIILMDCDMLLPQGIDPKQLYQYHQAVFNHKAWNAELTGKVADGRAVTCLISVSPVKDDLGETTHCVLELTDITERKRTELLIERKSEELSSANRELQEFAYVVSHDLKAPLRSIGALADWLVKDYAYLLPEEGQEQLTLLNDRAVRMQHMIDGVLEYSRAGRVSEQTSDVDINQLLEDVWSLLNPPARMQIIIQAGMPVIYAEKIRLTQLFQNLISNAIKYNDKAEGCIEVSWFDDGDVWRFGVKDNGPGIEPKYHDLVFGIFQTLNSKEESLDSTGIGLSLVRKVVELYRGSIWIESETDQGCTFWFTLPKNPLGNDGDPTDKVDD